MIRRQHEFRIEDILDRIRRIAIAEAQLTTSESGSSEEAAEMAFDAILYNLVVIGEAVKSLDADMKLRSPHIGWNRTPDPVIKSRPILVFEHN